MSIEAGGETAGEYQQPQEMIPISQIDFAKYQTPELVASISELISLPGKLRTVVSWVVIGTILLLLLVGLITFRRVPFVLWIVIETYAVPAGSVAGLFFGIAEMIRRSMNGMLRIVDLLLKTTADVATDVRSLQSGDQQLPPPGELVQAVYDQVIYPIVEQVVSGAFNFLGRPILWLYRTTLDRLVRVVVKRYVAESYEDVPQGTQETIQKNLIVTTKSVADNEGAIVASLTWTRAKVESIGGWLKLLVMLPCYLLFLLIASLVVLPIIVIAFLNEALRGDDQIAALIWLTMN